MNVGLFYWCEKKGHTRLKSITKYHWIKRNGLGSLLISVTFWKTAKIIPGGKQPSMTSSLMCTKPQDMLYTLLENITNDAIA